jgi:hypothetical protein
MGSAEIKTHEYQLGRLMPYHLATPAYINFTCEPYYMGVLLFGQVIFLFFTVIAKAMQSHQTVENRLKRAG